MQDARGGKLPGGDLQRIFHLLQEAIEIHSQNHTTTICASDWPEYPNRLAFFPGFKSSFGVWGRKRIRRPSKAMNKFPEIKRGNYAGNSMDRKPSRQGLRELSPENPKNKQRLDREMAGHIRRIYQHFE